VDVTESTLRSILEGSKQYRVPLYQRAYAWKNKNWETLWSDLVDLANIRKDYSNTSHFTGTLVLDTGKITTEMTQFLVVDGQQRLTTLSVLLAALAAQYRKQGDEMRFKKIQEQVLVFPFSSTPDSRYRLRPANYDESPFQKAVEGEAPKNDASLVDDAFRFFAKKLDNISAEQLTLEEIEAAILNGLKFVTITAKAEDNVYRIFESINNTGIALSQADLIRNVIFMRLGDEGSNLHATLWEPIQKDLEPEDIENLFWMDAQWRNAEVRKLDTYEVQKKHILGLNHDELVAYLKDCLIIANSLRRVRLVPSALSEQSKSIQNSLSRLSALEMPGALVLITRVVYLEEKRLADQVETAQALKTIESYLVRRAIAAVPVSNLGGICSACALQLNGDTAKEVHKRLSTGRRKYLTDSDIRKQFLEAPRYSKGRRDHLKLILSWLLVKQQGKDAIDFSTMTIEHVLPQNLEKASDEFALTLAPEDDLLEVHGDLVHTFGNLTLTNHNSELSNEPFSVKRGTWLSDTSVLENRAIAGETQWGPLEIRKRAERLAKSAIDEWAGPDESLLESEPATTGQLIDDLVAAIPGGNWTSYGEIAEAVGTNGQTVGNRIAKSEIPGAWRVLRTNGTVAPNFNWPNDSPYANMRPRTVLESEGIVFDHRDQASNEQKLNHEQLLARIGIDETE
jgi:alkylated DNA nucleotide flippase Atl1